jgi:hypothetical protein
MRGKALIALCLFLQILPVRRAAAAEAVPGDSWAGNSTNSFIWAGASESGGVVNSVFCNINWAGIINFQPSSKVGIGTTSPLLKVEITPSAALNGLLFHRNGAGNTNASGMWRSMSRTPGGPTCANSARRGRGIVDDDPAEFRRHERLSPENRRRGLDSGFRWPPLRRIRQARTNRCSSIPARLSMTMTVGTEPWRRYSSRSGCNAATLSQAERESQGPHLRRR